MGLILRAYMVEHVADADPSIRWSGRWLEVVDPARPRQGRLGDKCHPGYQLMCEAIKSDVQSAEGSGATALEEIRRIESDEIDLIESDGNGWVAHITRDKVWFEGLYDQGKGGEVSFAQYKLAVQTYVRFLADPQEQPIEVPFPAAEVDGELAVAGAGHSNLGVHDARIAVPYTPRGQTFEPAMATPTDPAQLRLVCKPGEQTDQPEQGRHHKADLYVIDAAGLIVPRFNLMCEAIRSDIQSVLGSGSDCLDGIRHVEAGEVDLIEVDGNACVAHITRHKVWFGNLDSQVEGSTVSLAQYKLAVQTYVNFLADPRKRAMEIEFPAG